MPPLSFSARPSLNFIFGHQLATPKAPTEAGSTAPTTDERPVSSDLSKFLNPVEGKKEPEQKSVPKFTIDLNGRSNESVLKSPPEDARNKADPGKKAADDESESYVEINMATDSQQDDTENLNEADLDSVKKQLNERAEQSQKGTFSLGATERTTDTKDPASARQRQLEDLVERMRADMSQYRTVVEQNNLAIKEMNEEYERTKERYAEEMAEAKEKTKKAADEVQTKQEECATLKDRVKELSVVIARAGGQLAEARAGLKSYAEFGKEAAKIASDPNMIDGERLVKYQLSINYACQLSHKFNLAKIDDTLKYMKEFAAPETRPMHEKSYSVPPPIPLIPAAAFRTPNKYEHLLKHLKAETAVLSQQATELERVMGTMPPEPVSARIPGKDLCWGIKEVVTARSERDNWQNMYTGLEGRYNELLSQPISQAKMGRLAQILAHLPKRRKEAKASEETAIQEQVARLKDEIANNEDQFKMREEELQRLISELTNKLAEKEEERSGAERETVELRKKAEELLDIIRLKDQQLETLRRDLDMARQQLESLLSRLDRAAVESHSKDLEFVERMREVKTMFTDMREEKQGKQAEILVLRQRCAELEKLVAGLRTTLAAAQTQIKGLSEQNRGFESRFERYMNPVDGFRALISLANLVLGKAKSSPQLSTKDKQMINDIFTGGAKEMLEEITRLQQEGKAMREELRRLLSDRTGLRTMLEVSLRLDEFR